MKPGHVSLFATNKIINEPNPTLQSRKISCGEKYVNIDPLNTECVRLTEEFKQVCTFPIKFCELQQFTNLEFLWFYLQSVSRIYEELVLDTNCDTTSPDCYVSNFKSSSNHLSNYERMKILTRLRVIIRILG